METWVNDYRQELYQIMSEELWERFDQVNEDLVLTYQQLCRSREMPFFQELKQKAFLLRDERKHIMEQIRQLHAFLSS